MDWGHTVLARADLSQSEELNGWFFNTNEVAVSTLLRTVAGLQHRPKRKAQVEAFLKKSGVPEEVLAFYRQSFDPGSLAIFGDGKQTAMFLSAASSACYKR